VDQATDQGSWAFPHERELPGGEFDPSLVLSTWPVLGEGVEDPRMALAQ